MKTEDTNLCDEMRRQFDLHELQMNTGSVNGIKFESHFNNCTNCKNWLADWEMLKRASRKLPDLEVPDAVFTNVISAIDEAPSVVKIINRDVVLTCLALAVLIVAFIVQASAGVEECVSWCLSFLILLAVQQFVRARHLLGAA